MTPVEPWSLCPECDGRGQIPCEDADYGMQTCPTCTAFREAVAGAVERATGARMYSCATHGSVFGNDLNCPACKAEAECARLAAESENWKEKWQRMGIELVDVAAENGAMREALKGLAFVVRKMGNLANNGDGENPELDRAYSALSAPATAAYQERHDREVRAAAFKKIYDEADGVGKCPWEGVEDHGVTLNLSAKLWCEIQLSAMESANDKD